MNFEVEHIGKVRKADIILDGITVVAGPNGSGKSTIGRALMTMCSTFRQLPSRIMDEKLKSARELITGILKSHNLPEIAGNLLSDHDSFVKFLRPESWKDYTIIENQIQDDPHYAFAFFEEDDDGVKSDSEKIFAIKDEIIAALTEVQNRNSTYYLPTIFTDSFETAFSKEFHSSGAAQEPCSACLTTENQAASSIQFDSDDVCHCRIASQDKTPFTFYFEPVHLLDLYATPHDVRIPRISARMRYKAPDADWRGFLFKEVDKSKWSLERKQEHAKIEKTLDELLNVMRGHLERQGRELFFADKDVSLPVPVMNVASGIKTMSVIEKGIRAGAIRPGCLLIIDEPESNLHPQWQIEFAHFLVKLQSQFNMRLLLNTHSPFFLKAVEVFSREEGCGERTHYYHMEKDLEGSLYSAKELKDGTNEIFKTYFDAMNDLMSR